MSITEKPDIDFSRAKDSSVDFEPYSRMTLDSLNAALNKMRGAKDDLHEFPKAEELLFCGLPGVGVPKESSSDDSQTRYWIKRDGETNTTVTDANGTVRNIIHDKDGAIQEASWEGGGIRRNPATGKYVYSDLDEHKEEKTFDIRQQPRILDDGTIRMVLEGKAANDPTLIMDIRPDGSWEQRDLKTERLQQAKDALGRKLECQWDSDGNLSKISLMHDKQTLELIPPSTSHRIGQRLTDADRYTAIVKPFGLVRQITGDFRSVLDAPKNEYETYVNGARNKESFYVGAAAGAQIGPAGVGVGASMPLQEKVKAGLTNKNELYVDYSPGVFDPLGTDKPLRIVFHSDGTQTRVNQGSSDKPLRIGKDGEDVRKSSSIRVK